MMVRTALVTGGATGIGAAISTRLINDGMQVYAIQRTEGEAETGEREFLDLPGASRICVGVHDLMTDGYVTAISACIKRFGAIDVLVNNAAITGRPAVGSLDEFGDDRIDSVIDTNLKAPLRLAREALPYLVSEKGVIVNIGSTAGTNAQPDAAAYAASKAGLSGLTRALAWDLAALGVRVVEVVPGDVETETSRAPSFVENRTHVSWRKRSPLGRSAKPEEVANAVAWAISDAAAYVTGSAIFVDGGLAAF